MSLDTTFIDPRFPDQGYDGKETFAAVLRTHFPRWVNEGKAAGLSRAWSASTSVTYRSHYVERLLPLLPVNKPLHEYTEEDFNKVLDDLQKRYPLADDTLEHYRHLLWIVYEAGVEDGLYPDQIFWGAVYDPSEHTEAENEEHRVRILIRLRKSLSKRENLAFMQYILALDPETASGEELGLAIMYLYGARNNEACGLDFKHIYQLSKYEGLTFLDLIQSTTINSNRVKAGGKTRNAPRTLIGMAPIIRLLAKRRAVIEEKIARGEFQLPLECQGDVGNLPIVCRGTSFGVRCTSGDLSLAGRKLFEKIGIRKSDLAEIHQILRRKHFEDDEIQEKEPTTYLLRRNDATILHALGFSDSDIQYYLGHNVEDPDTERSHYTNKDKLRELAEKLRWHPIYLLSGEGHPGRLLSLEMDTLESHHAPIGKITAVIEENGEELTGIIQSDEANDELSVNFCSRDGEEMRGYVVVSPSLHECEKTVSIQKKLWDSYGNVRK